MFGDVQNFQSSFKVMLDRNLVRKLQPNNEILTDHFENLSTLKAKDTFILDAGPLCSFTCGP